jgi:hypothetical protein
MMDASEHAQAERKRRDEQLRLHLETRRRRALEQHGRLTRRLAAALKPKERAKAERRLGRVERELRELGVDLTPPEPAKKPRVPKAKATAAVAGGAE